MSVQGFVSRVHAGTVDVVENTTHVLELCKKITTSHNLFTTLDIDGALAQARALSDAPTGKLAGVCISVKECICVKGMQSTAGSKILEGYVPQFDATAVARARAEGAIVIGKSAQDEFGFGGFSTNVGIGYKVPKNPLDDTRSCGGSSGGAAGLAHALASTSAHIGLSESTGGSIACPASFCGVVGFTPTYGRVSRYGLIDYGNSLDKIGPMGATVADCALLMNVIAGHDSRDSTSSTTAVADYTAALDAPADKLKIGILTENITGADAIVAEHVQNAVKKFTADGITCEEVSLPTVHKYGVPTYYLLAMSEASTNLAKYCGMRYGHHEPLKGGFNEYFSAVRSAALGTEAKRRIIVGTFARMAGFRDAYYLKAMKVRAKLLQEYMAAFEKYDVLLSPTMPMVAPQFNELEKLTPLQHYMADVCTAPVNLVGLPHISVPCGTDTKTNMPVGMMLVGKHFAESTLFTLANYFTK